MKDIILTINYGMVITSTAKVAQVFADASSGDGLR